MNRLAALFVAGAAAVAAWMPSGPAFAEPLNIRISWAITPAHLTPLINLVPKDIYRHYGKSYTVTPVRIAGSGPALQAMAAGEVDVAGLSAQALVLGVSRAKLDLRVIAQLMSSGVEGHPATQFYARKGEIKSPADFKGKTIGINARNSTIDAGVRAYLGKHGLEDGKDFRLVEIRFPAMIAALESKRIDAGPLLQPFSLTADKTGKYEQVFEMSDGLGGTQTLQYIARADWIAKNRAALVDFMEDHLRLRRWINDPANRKQAIEILAKETRQPASAFEEWAFSKIATYYYANDAVSDTDLLQKNIDDLVKLGVLPNSVSAEKYTDSSMAHEAGKRLK